MTDSKDQAVTDVIAEDAAARMQPLVTLTEAMRQFRHNNSDELVAGYDYDLTRKAFNELRQQLADVSAERDQWRDAHETRRLVLISARDERDNLQLRLNASEARNAELERADECWRAVIGYMLGEGFMQEPMEFLRQWNMGQFDVLREEWPDAPQAIYLADPLAQSAPATDEQGAGS